MNEEQNEYIGNLEGLHRVWKLLEDDTKGVTVKRTCYVISEILVDMRNFIRTFSKSSEHFEAAIHISQWGELFTYLLERMRKDVKSEYDFDYGKMVSNENKIRAAHDAEIADLKEVEQERDSNLNQMETDVDAVSGKELGEGVAEAEQQKLNKEIDKLKNILANVTADKDKFENELHYKLQETCKISSVIRYNAWLNLDVQQKYEGAESMSSMEKLLGQMGTSLRHTQELIEDKDTTLNSFTTMIKLIKLSVSMQIIQLIARIGKEA